MTHIDWNKVKNFKPSEFPEDPNNFADPELLYALQKYRLLLGEKIFPSPVKGALARMDRPSKESQHYAVGRRSTAIDLYTEGFPFQAYQIALASQLFGGIGVYFNAKYNWEPWPRFHFDIRRLGLNHSKKMVLVWYVDKRGKVKYPQYNETHNKEFITLFLEFHKEFHK